jgi:hypothetical protein
VELVSIRTEAGSRPGRVRLVGEVRYDDRATEDYWFEAPEEFAEALSHSGNPWLACLLPLAVTLRQPLRLRLPIDPLLSQNAARLMRTWTGWYPRLRVVPIEADIEAPDAQTQPETAAFFSGGVDSFYTVLRNREASDRARAPRIQRLLCVRGFDIDLENIAEYERLRSRLASAARDLDLELVEIATNLRDVRFRQTEWGRLSHGSVLASLALALERRFEAVYIAATYTGGTPIRPWGSHPQTDPLFSTSRTRIIHDGDGIARMEKTEYVGRCEAALRSLHVCPRRRSSENCGDCRKCFLVMLTMELAGALSRCSTFPSATTNLDRVRCTYLKSPSYEYLFEQIQIRARAAGRFDIVAAIEESLTRTRRLNRLLAPATWMRTKPLLWRLARIMRERVLTSSPR